MQSTLIKHLREGWIFELRVFDVTDGSTRLGPNHFTRDYGNKQQFTYGDLHVLQL